MIKDITLNASSREGSGKGFARRLRAQGMIPAAVYGEGKEPVAVAVNARELAGLLRSEGHNMVFKLALPNGAGEPATVIVKDVQIDPVKGRLLHADMMRISMDTVTRVSVPIDSVGEPVGVKLQGGLLELQMHEVEVECLPGDIPDRIQLDVSNLNLGDHATVENLIYDSAKVKVLLDEHQVIAGVLSPRISEEAAPTAGEAGAAEPEVIKKGKTEE